jgi:GT2 family glycosyltransferase
MMHSFLESPLIAKVLLVRAEPLMSSWPGCEIMETDFFTSGQTWNSLIRHIRTEYILIVNGRDEVIIAPGALKRFLDVAEATGAGLIYSDYCEQKDGNMADHPVNDYQTGSIREGFDFGPVMIFPLSAIRSALEQYGDLAETKYAGLYDLRMKVSIHAPPFHIQEFLYTRKINSGHTSQREEHFDYVDPRNYAAQKEMEEVATQHLKHIGAYLPPEFMPAPSSGYAFPLEASVVIPVLNRERTITDAIKSVLSQKTNFPFNVIVVDNHSTDGTTATLIELAKRNSAVRHIVPSRVDLSIGGCWNEAIASPECGRYAVQLDSDDLYGSPETLQKLVDALRDSKCAMVIGSYTLVDKELEEIPPGLIDHREWSDENGHNNALRVNGLGAPRAYDTALIRKIGFLNVGYGEDYALALRLCREYRIGRIYESLYLCRRWSGNTDASLAIETRNRYDAFKDKIRTIEIMARQKKNREKAAAT